MAKKYRITQKEYVITLADGNDYKVKPLTLAESKNMAGLLKATEGYDEKTDLREAPEVLDKVIEVVAKILQRTNSGLSEVRVGELVSIENIKPILLIAFGGSPDEVEEIK